MAVDVVKVNLAKYDCDWCPRGEVAPFTLVLVDDDGERLWTNYACRRHVPVCHGTNADGQKCPLGCDCRYVPKDPDTWACVHIANRLCAGCETARDRERWEDIYADDRSEWIREVKAAATCE
jgi:hypothetical protein